MIQITSDAEGPGSNSPPSRDACIHALFEERAERTPNAVAATHLGETATYHELNIRANRLAHALQELGVGPETRVGICLEISLDMLVAILGVLKAGGGYLPLDPTYPDERLGFLLDDSGAEVLVTHSQLDHEWASTRARVLRLDVEAQALERRSETNPASRSLPENLAYLIYTSGSTGVPKGVAVTHKSLVSASRALASRYQIGTQDRVLQFAALNFDVSAEEIFPTWLCGATLVLRTNASLGTWAAFSELLDKERVTVLNLPSSFWQKWLSQLLYTGQPTPACLRCVIVGSESVSAADLERWQGLVGDRLRFCNAYGTTETTITTTIYEPEPGSKPPSASSLPIGRPLGNSRIYVLDSDLQPLAEGVEGELFVAGDGVARGYHGRPALTAERFLPDPFSPEPGARFYRTGDRVRILPDGNAEFLGRKDDQVKIRGFRVELGEIETVLNDHPGVEEAGVLAVQSSERPQTGRAGVDDLFRRLISIDAHEREDLLAELERMSHEEAEAQAPARDRSASESMRELIRRKDQFEISLRIHDDFLRPPRESQRNWILQRTIDEFSDDLCALDRVSRRFVAGSQRPRIEGEWSESRAEYDGTQLLIEKQQVMQDWERPLMEAMARVATAQHGDVLEVGFGMGISATYIQQFGARSHSIIECNEDVAEAFRTWRADYPDRDIRLIPGKWQDVEASLGSYDAILFDTYPLDEEEFVKNVIESVNFAEHFFATASRCLRPGGSFTYYSNEIDSFSRRHQRLLFEHFSSFTLSVVESLSPPEDNNYWWADSMVVVEAKK